MHSDGLAVFDEFITISDILEPIRAQIESMAKSLPPDVYYPRVAELVRQQLVDAVAQRLIYRRAAEQIDDQIEPQVQKTVDKMERERINREFGGLETEYEKHVQAGDRSREEVRERLRRTVIVSSYLRETLVERISAPRKRDLLNYYQAHIDDYSKPERRELFMIDIMVRAFQDPRRPLTPEARQKAREAVEAAAAALRAGEPFEEVAKEYSEGANKHNGGSWGLISSPMSGRWEKPFQRFLELKEDEVSEIIEAADSFFIVKAGRIDGEKVKSFQEVQPEIVRILREQAFQRLKTRFLQRELERSTIGNLDAFAAQIVLAVPPPRGPTGRSASSVSPSGSGD